MSHRYDLDEELAVLLSNVRVSLAGHSTQRQQHLPAPASENETLETDPVGELPVLDGGQLGDPETEEYRPDIVILPRKK